MRLRMSVEQQQGGTLATAKRMETTCRPLNAGRSESLKHQIGSCASGACRLEKEKGLVSRFTYTAICFAGRTTRLTPSAVSAVPATVTTVIGSPNNAQAIKAVVGGTR